MIHDGHIRIALFACDAQIMCDAEALLWVRQITDLLSVNELQLWTSYLQQVSFLEVAEEGLYNYTGIDRIEQGY